MTRFAREKKLRRSVSPICFAALKIDDDLEFLPLFEGQRDDRALTK
jgi:hypothetical protein